MNSIMNELHTNFNERLKVQAINDQLSCMLKDQFSIQLYWRLHDKLWRQSQSQIYTQIRLNSRP